MSSEVSVEKKEYAVLYCVGAFDPRGRLAGVGVHGFFFEREEPKRGTGNPKAVPSDIGYVTKECALPKVSITQYCDLTFGNRALMDEREGELTAFITAMETLRDYSDLKGARIYIDSQLVVKGACKHLDQWIERNWILTTGNRVKYIPLWERIKELRDALKDKLEYFDIILPSEEKDTTPVGLESAGKNASRGLVMARKGDEDILTTFSPAQGYWTAKVEVPRILQAPRWYFTTTDTEYKTADGLTRYYVGCHGTKDKEDDFVSKRYSDNFLGVVLMNDPDPVMEAIRTATVEKDPKAIGKMAVAYLDNLFASKSYATVQEHGVKFIYEHKTQLDLMDADQVPLLVEINPPGRSFRLQETWKSLTRALDAIRSNDPYYRLTEVTDLLYEVQDNKKKSRVLKSNLTSASKTVDFSVEFNLQPENAEPKPFTSKIRMILGEDILTRNQLAALAETVKRVCVITWRESDSVGRYATYIELENGDQALWCRFDANFHLSA